MVKKKRTFERIKVGEACARVAAARTIMARSGAIACRGCGKNLNLEQINAPQFKVCSSCGALNKVFF